MDRRRRARGKLLDGGRRLAVLGLSPRALALRLRLRFACATVVLVTTLVRDRLLASIADPLDLSKTELARLFGVRRQAIDGWHRHGVPPARQAKAATVAAIVDLLSHQLKDERLPGIARRPAQAYGGLTMLEMIERDRHEELLERTRRSFDWATTS